MALNSNQSTNELNLSPEFIKQEPPEQPEQQKTNLKTLGLYPFHPLTPVMICPIHRLTMITNIVTIINQVPKIILFFIYTKRNIQTQQVTTITMQFIGTTPIQPNVVVFDLLHLPEQNTIAFTFLKALLLQIFVPEKKCYIWNSDQQKDLFAFVDHQCLSPLYFESIQPIQLQKLFKSWYNKTFSHDKKCCVPKNYSDDSIYCLCSHRPYKHLDDEWELLRALYHTFNESLYIIDEKVTKIPKYIQFSVGCCKILAKLFMVMELNLTREQLCLFKRLHQYRFR